MRARDIEVRFHHLKLAGTKSPAHVRAVLDAGDKGGTGAAMEKGSAVHGAILDARPVTSYPGAVRRGKEWEAFQDTQPPGTIILSKSDYADVMGMVEAVSAHADAMRLLSGVREVTLRWNALGIKCRATPDAAVYTERVVELKTCQTSHPDQFARQAIRYGYHAQLAWYRSAIVCNKLGSPKDAYIVAVESTAPYPVTVLKLTERAMDMGNRIVSLWFERLSACIAADEWPGYVQSIVDLDVPEDDGFELDFGEAA